MSQCATDDSSHNFKTRNKYDNGSFSGKVKECEDCGYTEEHNYFII